MEVGNNRAMRDALEGVAEIAKKDMANYMYADTIGEHKAIKVWSSLLSEFCDRALAAPPRNCDVGTPKEQAERFELFCSQYRAGRKVCVDCPFAGDSAEECVMRWAQMPYETKEKGEE